MRASTGPCRWPPGSRSDDHVDATEKREPPSSSARSVMALSQGTLALARDVPCAATETARWWRGGERRVPAGHVTAASAAARAGASTRASTIRSGRPALVRRIAAARGRDGGDGAASAVVERRRIDPLARMPDGGGTPVHRGVGEGMAVTLPLPRPGRARARHPPGNRRHRPARAGVATPASPPPSRSRWGSNPVEPRRQPPVGVAEQGHRRRHQPIRTRWRRAARRWPDRCRTSDDAVVVNTKPRNR